MRLATGEELALQSPMPEQDLKELARILKDPEGNKGFEDDSNAAAPPKPPPPRMSASRQLLRAQGQAMMRGLRSAKRLLSVLPPTRQNSTKRRKMIADGQRPMALPPPPEAPRERLQLPGVAARALAPPEPDHQPDDVSPVPTTPLDDTQAEPPRVLDEELQNIEVRRRHLLDDVPISVKRKEIPRADPSTDHVHKKLRVAYVFALASMFQGQDAPQNEWLSKYEVAMLKSLTGLEVTSARLHRAPRKRMQVPTKARNRARTSVLIGQDPSVTLVVEENAQEVTMHPKKKAPFLWTGLTIFHREKTHKSHRVYVELPGGLIEAKMHPEEAAEFHTLWCEEIRDRLVADALVLRLKENKKELDPKFFNSEEQKAFERADQKEWSQWLANKVVRFLQPDEAARVPRSKIFRAPMRIVRVNKAAEKLAP